MLLGALALVTRLPLFLSTRALSFDDAVYGVSVVDMRRGMVPYRDVFSSQGPLHLPLLYVGDLVGLHSIDAPRVTSLVSGVVVTLAVWACARRLGAGASTAALVAALTATTGSMLWTTGQITGDGPAVALAALAVYAALRYRDDGRVVDAVLAGAFFGAAVATKAIVVATAIPLTAWLARRARRREVLLAAAFAGATWLAAAVPWGLVRVWQQSVSYHLGAGPSYGRATQLAKLAYTLATRDALLLGAFVLAVVGARAATRQLARDETAVLAAWFVAAALVLVFEKALYSNHVATAVLPLALLVASHPPPARWFALALVVLLPWEIVNQHDVLLPQRYSGTDARVVAALRALPHDAQVIADDPGLVWRAGHATPPQFNDTTDMRVFQHELTTSVLVHTATRPETCAVVISPSGFAVLLPGIRSALARAGYHVVPGIGSSRELWERQRCTAA